MRLSMYAHDLGPAKNLSPVAHAAIQKGHRVRLMANLDGPDHPNPLNTDILAMMGGDAKPDVLVTGLSSFKNWIELALGARARQKNTPWVVMADSHNTWGREAAQGRVENAHVLVASPLEINAAREFGYRDAQYLGGPPLWETFRNIPEREIPRKKTGNKVILVGGGKDPFLTDGMIMNVVLACMRVLKDDWELIFKPHPNEDKENFDQGRRGEVMPPEQNISAAPQEAETTELIPSADLSVFPIGSTDTIAAAHMGRPVISYEDESMLARFRKMTGSEVWFPSEAGAALRTTGNQIRVKLECALSPEVRTRLRKRQEEVYPIPAIGEKKPATRILEFLEELKA